MVYTLNPAETQIVRSVLELYVEDDADAHAVAGAAGCDVEAVRDLMRLLEVHPKVHPMSAALIRAARAVLFCLDSPLPGDVRPLMGPAIAELRAALAAEPPAVGYGVTAHRLASSVAGPGRAPLKGRDGRPQLFATLADARSEAARLNAATASPNVRYVADPEPQERRPTPCALPDHSETHA